MVDELPLEEIAGLSRFRHPAVSPGGDQVAYYYDGTGRNELHGLYVETGEMFQISDGNVPRNAFNPFVWDPTGDRFFFHQDESGEEQYDIMSIDHDANVETVVDAKGKCKIVDVSSDGTRLLYTNDAGERITFYECSLETGETTPITEDIQTMTGSYSPGGERIAYKANETDHPTNRDIYVANADGSDARKLEISDVGAEAEAADWHPDGDWLLVKDNSIDKPRCGIYDFETSEVTWYTDESHVESPKFFLPDGSGFVAVRTRKCARSPVVYDLESGESHELDLPEGVVTFPRGRSSAFLSDREVLMVHYKADQPPALLTYNLDTDETEALIEPEYGSFEPERFVDCEYVTFESYDGLEIEALVYDSGVRPSPAVLQIHGGPNSHDLRWFNPYTQFLVSLGYTVMQVNYRGSTGRGRTFKNAIVRDVGSEQKDIAEGARWLAGKDWIDEDRIAAFGDSYGGASAYLQLFHYPDLYAAGISWGGFTHWPSLYEETMPFYRMALKKYIGKPEENEGAYRQLSPITYVDNVDSPTCIIQGDNDPVCPISQARRMKAALEERGYKEGADGDFEYNVIEGEGHGSADIEYKIQVFEILADFLKRRVPVEEQEVTP